ncbi:unnamed protein product [Leuciscus chuanchicus]
MEALCVQIFVAGLGQLAQRTAEVESFSTGSHEAVADNQRKAAQITADFENFRRQKIVEMQQITDADLLEAHITSCHEQAEQFSENLTSLELQLVDQLELLVDKDTVTNAVSASHDTHLQKIDDREDELLARVNSWMSSLLKSIHNDEVKRNRKRISEIQNYISFVKDELEDMASSEDN